MTPRDGDRDWEDRALSLARLVPELAPPFSRNAPVRIPELRNVALTRRVLRVIDHPDFQRLRRVLQLGPTYLVYPGAVHTRFEHSLGVFENVRRYMLSLLADTTFASAVSETDVLTALAAGLLHDLGHYPFAHSLEALHHKGMEAPHHETLAGDILQGFLSPAPIAGLLEGEWKVDPARVIRLIASGPRGQASDVDAMLSSLLHAPIDADKMDYLERDSIHMGVPYGRNYDRERLLSSLRIHPRTHALAVTHKGKISAEIFVFCRYTMFSEAYWHHTVRAASAMMERALEDFRLASDLEGEGLARFLLAGSDEALVQRIFDGAQEGSAARRILGHFTGGGRSLYKRLLTLSRTHRDEANRLAYERVFSMDRTAVHGLEESIRAALAPLAGRAIHPADVIVDTPPPGKDRIEDVDVIFDDAGESAPLSSVSRIVEGVGQDFAQVVKKIRVFVEPETARAVLETLGKSNTGARILETILGWGELFADESLVD